MHDKALKAQQLNDKLRAKVRELLSNDADVEELLQASSTSSSDAGENERAAESEELSGEMVNELKALEARQNRLLKAHCELVRLLLAVVESRSTAAAVGKQVGAPPVAAGPDSGGGLGSAGPSLADLACF